MEIPSLAEVILKNGKLVVGKVKGAVGMIWSILGRLGVVVLDVDSDINPSEVDVILTPRDCSHLEDKDAVAFFTRNCPTRCERGKICFSDVETQNRLTITTEELSNLAKRSKKEIISLN